MSSQAIFFDVYLMGIGYLVMFCYTILMLGRLNTLEVKTNYLLILFYVHTEKTLFYRKEKNLL